jgi:glycosyltransferase involved in cell wall biosynthesis
MRVGLVVYGDLERTSGGYLYDRKLVEHLRRRGDEVIVFSQPERPYPLGVVDTLDLPFWRRIAGSDLDVLLQDELNHASLAFGNWWLRRRLDAPIVAIVHHLRASEPRSMPETGLANVLERLYLQTTDAVVCNSTVTRRAVASIAGNRPGTVARPSGRRFDPAVDPKQIEQRADDGPLRLVFVGNLIPRKRLHLLVAGLARVESYNWQLDVVGDASVRPSYTDDVRTQIRRRRLGARVTLHGKLSDDALVQRLSRSHALAVPSAYEGYGIVYVEAMGRGLPVLASPHGGVRDVVIDGETGFFVETPADIACAVHTWCQDRDRLASMGRAAREQYCRTPTWADTANKIATFLDELVA